MPDPLFPNPNCAFCVTDGVLLYSESTDPDDPDAGTFYYVPAVKKVDFRFERNEPTKYRHSHSGGSRVNPCQNASITWYMDVLCQLCSSDWLWSHLDPTDFETVYWFRWYPDGSHAGQNPTEEAYSWQGRGTIVPGDLSFDNDSDDPTDATFTIELMTSSITWPTGWTADPNKAVVE